jgi:hypothetical protein
MFARSIICLFLLACLMGTGLTQSNTTPSKTPPKSATTPTTPKPPVVPPPTPVPTVVESQPLPPAKSLVLKSAELARDVNTMTGLAISPLLTLSMVGAYNYWTTPAELRHQLSIFSHPLIWGAMWALLIVVLSKDVILGLVPSTGIRNLINGVEAASRSPVALIALIAYLPTFFNTLHQFSAPESAATVQALSLHSPQLVAGLGETWQTLLLWIVLSLVLIGSLFSFGVYFIVSQCLSILAALAPFGFMVWLIKLGRLLALGALLVCAMISPFLGLAVVIVGTFAAWWLTRKCWKVLRNAWLTVREFFRGPRFEPIRLN